MQPLAATTPVKKKKKGEKKYRQPKNEMEASTWSAQVFPVNRGIKYLNRFIFSTTRYTVSDEGKAAKAEVQRVPGIISIEKRLRWNFNSPARNLAKKMGTGIQTPGFERAPVENYWVQASF